MLRHSDTLPQLSVKLNPITQTESEALPGFIPVVFLS
jgi:hypothetical protein